MYFIACYNLHRVTFSCVLIRAAVIVVHFYRRTSSSVHVLELDYHSYFVTIDISCYCERLTVMV